MCLGGAGAFACQDFFTRQRSGPPPKRIFQPKRFEVWKARDLRLDRIVALKRLKAEHSARFEKEARAIAALNHPHICALYDIGPDYLVMEYVEGAPVSGPIPVGRAVKLAIQIAAARQISGGSLPEHG